MISNQSMARRVLRRSGFSHKEQRQVLSSRGHEYDLDKIKDALRLTYGDAHKDDHKRPFSRSQGQTSKGQQGGFRKKFFRKRHGAHVMESIPEQEQDDYEYDDYEYEYDEDWEDDGEWNEGDEDAEDQEQDPDDEDAEDHEQQAEDEQDEDEEVFTK